MSRVVGQRGDVWFLIHVDGEGLDARGRIVNRETGQRSPIGNFQTLLAQGYWEEPGDLSAEDRRALTAGAATQ